MESIESEAALQGQAEIWQFTQQFADSMALKCAVDLRIPDIIHAHDSPITVSQMASAIDSTSPDVSCLARILKLLVRKKIFTATPQSNGGETLYGLTPSSRWLLHDSELSLAPMLKLETSPWLVEPWYHLSGTVREGGNAFKRAHGREIFDFASANPGFNKSFNEAMECTAKIFMKAVVSGYKDGFGSIGSLVDVGGGTGTAITEIVKAYPHVKGINFDLPHVVRTAPEYQGVAHVGGDMFKAVPNADAVFMKWIMHDWSDIDCVKILKNCRKAIPEKTGKIIIVDIVLRPEGEGLFDSTAFVFDVGMIAHSVGGKERSEPEWKKLLEDGGFLRYKIFKIPTFLSIIEAWIN